MTLEQFVKEVGIPTTGTYAEDGSYVVDLENDVEYGKYYSRLDENEYLDDIGTLTHITTKDSSITYQYEDLFQISLISNWDTDEYRIVVREL